MLFEVILSKDGGVEHVELLVVRHGQSEADIIKCHEGRADFPLTETGVKQALLLAEWIKEKYPPDFILSSPLKRASQTAEIIAKKVDKNVLYFEELMEFNNGLLAGLPFEEAEIKYPKPKIRRPHEKYYEQESLIEFRTRAETILSKIVYEFPIDKRIMLLSHGGMINMLFRSFLNLPMNSDINIATSDTGIHFWKLENETKQIIFSNKVEHLFKA